jgi:hypothetical protein
MNKETFFKIIGKHFQKDEVNNFHGIIIKPYVDNDLLNFDFENPNDLSYNKTCLVNYFYDQCDFYGKILGIDESEMYKKYVNMYYTSYLSNNRIFLNDTDKQTLVKLVGKTKKFKINSSLYDIHLDADITVEHVYLESNDPESIGLNIELEFKNLTNPKKPNYSLNKNINVLRNWLYNEYRNYDDISNDMFKDAHDFIYNNPLLLDNSYMYINTNISPIVYDEEGDLAEF